MIRTLAIGHDHQVTVGKPLDQIVMEDYIWMWVDFSKPTDRETELLTSYFHFHPLAVEDCMHVLQRPKLDYYEDVQFLVVHALDVDTLAAEEVDMFISSRFWLHITIMS